YNYLKEFFLKPESIVARDQLDGKFTNVYAEPGAELTANRLTFTHLGRDEPVFIEPPKGIADSHSMSLLLDALSVRRVFESFESTLSSAEFDHILWRAFDREVEVSISPSGEPDMTNPDEAAISLNTLMRHLSTVLGGEFASYQTANQAAEFYQTLTQGGLPRFQLATLDSFENPLNTALNDTNSIGRALRYALLEGAPFIVYPIEAYSSGIFANGANDDAYGTEHYTETFWADRIDYYQRQLASNALDLNSRDAIGAKVGTDATHFFDDYSINQADANGQPQAQVYVRGHDSVYTNQ
ncbi:hypothetical protein, partial [Oleiphilus sp. HI0080]|uniref:hypothetical protein n=1 Tax=Oleiphilus sp. HI0080 TaxID=1822255 RepID=UPI000AB9A407